VIALPSHITYEDSEDHVKVGFLWQNMNHEIFIAKSGEVVTLPVLICL